MSLELSGVDTSHEGARVALFLTIGAVSPFILRSVGDWVIGYIIKICCDMTKTELTLQMIGKGESNMTVMEIWHAKPSWSEAREDLSINFCAALTVSMLRLIFWHWMQPMLYAWVLYAYWDLLDDGQQILASIVAGREALYFLFTLIGLIKNRSYLLVDLRATWKDEDVNGSWSVILYVIAPEKNLFMVILCDHPAPVVRDTGMICLCVLDMAGIVAFIWAIGVDNVYVPLMIGYGVTTIGGIFVFPLWCYSRLK